MKSSQKVLFFIIFGVLFILPEALLASEDTSLPPENINAVWYDYTNNGTPIAIVLPTHEADEVSQQMIYEYVSQIFSGLHAIDMLTDDEALAQSMIGKNIVAYGTPEGNTWLAEHFASLPFHIDPNQIIAGEVIEGSDLRLIAVWDNPDDPNKGLVVYTAQQTKDVVGIHSVFHGPTQFLIAREQQILRQGYYIPTDDGWSFSEYPYVDFPDFTHEQKLEDFDAMVGIIGDVFPAAQVNRMVYGLDIEQTLAAYREDVSDANTTEEFVTLLDRAIKACKGSHMDTDYVGTDYYASSEFLRSYTAGYLDEDTVRIHELYRDYLWLRNRGFALNLPLIYYQGEYYVLYDFTFEDTFFARGLKVEFCNGCTPDEILWEHQDAYSMLPWDFTRAKFHYTRFYEIREASPQGILDFVFSTADGQVIEVSFPADGTVTFTSPKRESGRAVVYFPKSRILYIRIPAMRREDIPFYEEGILREGKSQHGRSNRQVRAAVVDIRSNGGGSDSVWNRVLSKLLDQPVTYQVRFGTRNTETVRSYISRHSFGRFLLAESRPERIDFLGDKEFLTATADVTLQPASDSVRVPVVYVLSENVFSAAGSLTTLAGLVEPIISVGYHNPYILGMGIDPFHFSLPHSCFAFTIEPVIDLTGCQSASDVFHTDVEVEVQPTLEELLRFHNQPMEDELEDFLTAYDPVFQEVLLLLEAYLPNN